MLGFVGLLALGYALFLGWLIAFTAWKLAVPPRKTYAAAMARAEPGDPSELAHPRKFESWTFASRGRALAVWEIEGDDPSGPTLVMTPGWGDSRIGALVRVPGVAPVCRRMITWDPPGQGESRGWCSLGHNEPGDLLELVRTACERGGPVVLLGWSMGAGVSIAAAARLAEHPDAAQVCGVVAEAPNLDVYRPAQRMLRAALLPWRMNLRPALWVIGALSGAGPAWRGFRRDEHARRARCPLLIIHGHNDRLCLVEESRIIADAAADAELHDLAGCGHNDIWTSDVSAANCRTVVQSFIRRVAPPGDIAPDRRIAPTD